MTFVLGLAPGKQPWFWESADVIALSLLLLNVLLLAAVHLRRVRQYVRGKRERRFRAQIDATLADVVGETSTRDPEWLRRRLTSFDELERPIAATLLIERLRPAAEDERAQTLAVLREAGVIDHILAAPRARLPWRRALAVRTLGWVGADEAVPVVLERLSDPNRYVREAAVRALGRIGDPQVLPMLGELFRSPGSVGTGVVYDALIGFGPAAEPVFAAALESELESVRVAACFGVAALAEPEDGRRLLVPLLGDPSPRVRSAAASSLGQIGGEQLPAGLARATQDEAPAVRSAATRALGAYDDPDAVEVALVALGDSERDTAVRAGEALVRLSGGRNAGPAASEALRRAAQEWPVERALIYASLGAE